MPPCVPRGQWGVAWRWASSGTLRSHDADRRQSGACVLVTQPLVFQMSEWSLDGFHRGDIRRVTLNTFFLKTGASIRSGPESSFFSRHYFDEPKLAPWLTLSVQGFADSPVSWREREHGFRKGGEHLYSFVVFSNQDYWLQMAVGAEDDCPP